jgi:hypothetical protein
VFTGRSAVSLSSFGGEGQGEEVVVFNRHARDMVAATRWNVATNRGIENGPPLPGPPKEERENHSLVARVRQMPVRCRAAGHPTANIEHPMGARWAVIGCWVFDVGC